jgi:methyl-accepting chemotaxis protein
MPCTTSSANTAAKAQSETARLGMIALCAGAVLLSILVTVVLSRMISGAIARLTASTLKLADDDLAVEIEGSERKDGIGILAGAISAQIESVENVTRATVEAMKRIGGTIGEVSSVATSIASAVEQQGAATQEITRSTQQAAARTHEVSRYISGVSEGARTTSRAAQGVKSAAEMLSQQTGRLGDQINDFLAKIRAA